MASEQLQELGLELWPFSPKPDEEEQYLIVRSQVSGIICDIDLGRMELFANRLLWLKTENPERLRIDVFPKPCYGVLENIRKGGNSIV